MAVGHIRAPLGRTAFGDASFSTENEAKLGKYASDLPASVKYLRIGEMNAGCE